jgi:uncharacterized membrane protein (UPF0127 family)
MKVEYANNYLQKTFGLMFRRPGNYYLVFDMKKPSKAPVHTWFCRMPITMTFITPDGEKEVYENVPPFVIIKPKNKYVKLIETTAM